MIWQLYAEVIANAFGQPMVGGCSQRQGQIGPKAGH
jgi:hypothetical protein